MWSVYKLQEAGTPSSLSAIPSAVVAGWREESILASPGRKAEEGLVGSVVVA